MWSLRWKGRSLRRSATPDRRNRIRSPVWTRAEAPGGPSGASTRVSSEAWRSSTSSAAAPAGAASATHAVTSAQIPRRPETRLTILTLGPILGFVNRGGLGLRGGDALGIQLVHGVDEATLVVEVDADQVHGVLALLLASGGEVEDQLLVVEGDVGRHPRREHVGPHVQHQQRVVRLAAVELAAEVVRPLDPERGVLQQHVVVVVPGVLGVRAALG